MVGMALLPLINGVPVTLPIDTRDPRDLMRGNYAALRYTFSRVKTDTLSNDLNPQKKYNYGDALWVKLARKGEFYWPQGIYENKPEASIVLKAYVESAYLVTDSAQKPTLELTLRAGIEEYYTTQLNAQLLESQLLATDSLQAVAFVKVAPNGAARLEKIEVRKAVRR
jgi:uncharacterized membrane-anchored protein